MNYYELLSDCFKDAEKKAAGKIFIIKTETAERLRCIQSELRNGNKYAKLSLNFLTNSIDIRIEGYVFDSSVENVKRMFDTVDIFVIDALLDGRVCVEMRILNAFEII